MQYADEKILIDACKANSRSAQRAIYDRYAALFFSICCRYSKDAHDAEQLLQDVFLKIFQNIHLYHFKGSFEGWMKKIVVNTCLDFVKSKQFRNEKVTLYAEDVDDNYMRVSFNEAMQKMDAQPLLTYIQDLAPSTRLVFNLYVFEGYSHKEIAKLTGISEGTSQWHVNSARATLKKKINNALNKVKKKHEEPRIG